MERLLRLFISHFKSLGHLVRFTDSSKVNWNLVCSVEHIPGPPSFLESKVLLFNKLIAFNLSNYKKGEVITKTVSKGK